MDSIPAEEVRAEIHSKVASPAASNLQKHSEAIEVEIVHKKKPLVVAKRLDK